MKLPRALLLVPAILVALALSWHWLQAMSPEARERAARLRAPHTELAIAGWPRDSMHFLIDGCRLDCELPAGLAVKADLMTYVEVDGVAGCNRDRRRWNCSSDLPRPALAMLFSGGFHDASNVLVRLQLSDGRTLTRGLGAPPQALAAGAVATPSDLAIVGDANLRLSCTATAATLQLTARPLHDDAPMAVRTGEVEAGGQHLALAPSAEGGGTGSGALQAIVRLDLLPPAWRQQPLVTRIALRGPAEARQLSVQLALR